MPACPTCHAPLRPDGTCAACLLAAAQRDPDETQTLGHAPWQPPTPERLAELLPAFDVLALHGRGGMGAVYRARHRQLDRLVALKIAPAGAAAAERFAAEARALARLDHPHIVRVYEAGRSGSLAWMAMEFIDGCNLRRAMAEGRIAPPQVLAIVPQLCAALHYAHDLGIVHRDIKPENILMAADGQVKIADFGLALLRDTNARLTATGAVLGTPHYMAPEQIEHPQSVDHRADLYALGVVFYEMLTGELPLGRFAPPSRKVQIDVRLDEVVLRALEKEPEQRYQRAGEIATRMAGIAASRPRRWLPWVLWPGVLVVLIVAVWWIDRRQAVVPPAIPAEEPALPPVFRDAGLLADERCTTLAQCFDANLAQHLSAEDLAALWRDQATTWGDFLGFDPPRRLPIDTGFRFALTGHWQRQDQELILVYDHAHRITGLWLKPINP